MYRISTNKMQYRQKRECFTKACKIGNNLCVLIDEKPKTLQNFAQCVANSCFEGA